MYGAHRQLLVKNASVLSLHETETTIGCNNQPVPADALASKRA